MKASKDKILSNNQTCIQQLKILTPSYSGININKIKLCI